MARDVRAGPRHERGEERAHDVTLGIALLDQLPDSSDDVGSQSQLQQFGTGLRQHAIRRADELPIEHFDEGGEWEFGRTRESG